MELRVYNATTVWLGRQPVRRPPRAAAKAVRRSTELLRRHPVLFGLLSFIAAPLGGILSLFAILGAVFWPICQVMGW
mgnify:CR=1 FL=1